MPNSPQGPQAPDYTLQQFIDALLNRRPGVTGPQRTEDINLPSPNAPKSMSDTMVDKYNLFKKVTRGTK